MVSARKVSLTLTYLVSLGCFFSLQGIADEVFFFPLLLLFILSILNDWKFKTYPPRWVLNAGGIVVSIIILSQLSLENPVQPFANMILLLLTVKSLEEKRPRDIYQMLLLSLFGVAVSTTFRLDISFLMFFLYELFLGTIAFLFTNLFANMGDKPLQSEVVKKYTKFALAFPLIIALLSIPFFLLLPRTHTPLFDLFAQEKKGLTTGIAQEVELGKVGNIQQDNTVVMRIYGEIPPDPYWRVSVFDTLVGTKWITTVESVELEPATVYGNTYLYTIIMEPTFDTYLPLLDYPMRLVRIEGFRGDKKRLRGGFYRLTKPLIKPVKLRAMSASWEPDDPPMTIHLQVPRDIPDSIKKLAEDISKDKDELERVKAVEDFFKRGFSYSLKIEKPQGDPIEHFLFRSKKGNCEFFASSTALLLRLMGIPARIVGGYRGVIKNQYGDYYIVTNSMAHVWVEAFVDGRWIRIDTTPPYVSPSLRRISKLDLIRDALISFWYENVVDFSAQKQVSLLRNLALGVKSLSLENLKGFLVKAVYPIVIGLTVLAVLKILYNLWYRSPENLYRKTLKKLESKLGVNLRDKLPEEVIREVEGTPYFREVRFIVGIYQRHRFSPHRVSRKELAEGYRVLRKI